MDWQTAGIVIGTITATLTVTLTVVKMVSGSSWKLSGRLTSIEVTLAALRDTNIGMQKELEAFGETLIEIARMNGRLDGFEKRIGNNERDIRELRHGEGYVLPLSKSSFEKP